jgi:Mg2+ and Co2+ transporter CorA
LITLTLLKSNGGAAAETVSGFPEQVGPGEMLWVDAESPTERELADLKKRFSLDDYAVEDGWRMWSTGTSGRRWRIMGRTCSR